MKRLLSALMVIVLCLAVLPLGSPVKAAADGQLTYEITAGEVTITRCAYDVSGSVVVPVTIEGYPVTAIADAAFYECDLLTSITFPAGLRSIGVRAFYGCDRLEDIYFYGDAPVFDMSYGMCYDHEDDPWADLDFDFSAEHECGPFENVFATVYYSGGASGWDAVTSADMTGKGCNLTKPQGNIALKQLTPTTLSGSVTAFGDGAVSVELTSKISYPISLSATDSTYQLQDLFPGEYTLIVSQTGSVTRTYSLTINEGENVLDLKLHQPGDINGDGRYDIGDVARIYSHAKSSRILTGYELLCADFTGDGKVTVGDAAKAYSGLRGN